MYGNYNNTIIKMYLYCLHHTDDIINYYSIAMNRSPYYFKDNVLFDHQKLFSDGQVYGMSRDESVEFYCTVFSSRN